FGSSWLDQRSFRWAPQIIATNSWRRSIARGISTRIFGRSTGSTAGCAGFGEAPTKKSGGSCTSPAGRSTRDGGSTTIRTRPTTTRPDTVSARTPSHPASTFQSAATKVSHTPSRLCPLNRPCNRARIRHIARIELSYAATYLAQWRRSPAPPVRDPGARHDRGPHGSPCRPADRRSDRHESRHDDARLGACVASAIRAAIHRDRAVIARRFYRRVRTACLGGGRARAAPAFGRAQGAMVVCFKPARRDRSSGSPAVLVRVCLAGRSAGPAGVSHGALSQVGALLARHALALGCSLQRAPRLVRLLRDFAGCNAAGRKRHARDRG